VDEDAWASLYRTENRPFAKPRSGRIAADFISHYPDEAMRASRLRPIYDRAGTALQAESAAPVPPKPVNRCDLAEG
jgi:hypothetical protein